jgi:hypothetical protein
MFIYLCIYGGKRLRVPSAPSDFPGWGRNAPGAEGEVPEAMKVLGQTVREKVCQVTTELDKLCPIHLRQEGWPKLIAEYGPLLDHSPRLSSKEEQLGARIRDFAIQRMIQDP